MSFGEEHELPVAMISRVRSKRGDARTNRSIVMTYRWSWLVTIKSLAILRDRPKQGLATGWCRNLSHQAKNRTRVLPAEPADRFPIPARPVAD